MDDDILSIEETFGDLKDPRSRTPAHDLTEMLMVALCAILSGADSWMGIELWGQAKLEWLRRHIPLQQGIPSHDIFRAGFRCAQSEAVRNMLHPLDEPPVPGAGRAGGSD